MMYLVLMSMHHLQSGNYLHGNIHHLLLMNYLLQNMMYQVKSGMHQHHNDNLLLYNILKKILENNLLQSMMYLVLMYMNLLILNIHGHDNMLNLIQHLLMILL